MRIMLPDAHTLKVSKPRKIKGKTKKHQIGIVRYSLGIAGIYASPQHVLLCSWIMILAPLPHDRYTEYTKEKLDSQRL
jgi:hypothetical protein